MQIPKKSSLSTILPTLKTLYSQYIYINNIQAYNNMFYSTPTVVTTYNNVYILHTHTHTHAYIANTPTCRHC